MQFRHWESWRQFRKIICPLSTFKMPRKRDRVTNRASWTEGDLRMAKEYMESHGCSMRTASIKFSIPYSTFKERVLKGKTGKPKMGCEPVFNENQEREMVQHILHLSNLFYGLTPTHLRKVAYEFAEANNIKHPFNKNSKMAGYDWLQGLIKRNPVISIRKPEATSVNRITAFNRNAVGRFFDNLESVMAKQQFPPERIFNMDETGITTVSEPVKVLSEKGKKRIGTVTSWERGKNVTVICAMSATGIFVPPMFVFARKKMSSLLSTNGPRGAAYECSDNGWSNEVLFIKWLHHFVKHTTASPENPLLLILDNHCSHTTLEGYELCRNNGITLLSIPPHTSHRTQPLDVTFYGPLKTLFRQKSYAFMKQVDGFSNESRPKRSDGLVQITPYDLASIFNAAYVEAAKLSVAISGFKNTGIFPLNRNIFTDNDFLPSEVLAGQSPSSMVEGIDLPAPSPGISATPAIPANSQVEDTPSPMLLSSNSPPSTLSCPFRSFADMPTPAAAVKKNTRSKQHSEILTATPRKLVLLEKRQAKFEKKRKETKRAEKKAKRPVKVALDFRCSTSSNNENAQPKEKPGNKRNLRESKRRRKQPYEDDTDSEELDDPSTEELCDDNDCDDAEGIEDLCTICQEYEKDAPLWMCNECHHKAHYFCSGGYPPRGLCDLCENLL